MLGVRRLSILLAVAAYLVGPLPLRAAQFDITWDFVLATAEPDLAARIDVMAGQVTAISGTISGDPIDALLELGTFGVRNNFSSTAPFLDVFGIGFRAGTITYILSYDETEPTGGPVSGTGPYELLLLGTDLRQFLRSESFTATPVPSPPVGVPSPPGLAIFVTSLAALALTRRASRGGLER